MSTLKTKKVQLGDNADPSKNFLIEVPAVADGTLSIKRQDGTNVLSIDATGKAVIPGVVGTVAQVGGVPTGQVVERGSNANGSYVRFADGTQICTVSLTGYATTSFVTGGIYTSQELVWTLPSSFVGPPAVVTGRVRGYAASSWIGLGSNASNDVTEARVSVKSSIAIPATVDITLSAIGRWF